MYCPLHYGIEMFLMQTQRISGYPASHTRAKVVDLTLTMKNGYINIKGAVIAPNGNPADYVRHAPIDPDQGISIKTYIIQSI